MPPAEALAKMLDGVMDDLNLPATSRAPIKAMSCDQQVRLSISLDWTAAA